MFFQYVKYVKLPNYEAGAGRSKIKKRLNNYYLKAVLSY